MQVIIWLILYINTLHTYMHADMHDMMSETKGKTNSVEQTILLL